MTEGADGLAGMRTNMAWKALFEGWVNWVVDLEF